MSPKRIKSLTPYTPSPILQIQIYSCQAQTLKIPYPTISNPQTSTSTNHFKKKKTQFGGGEGMVGKRPYQIHIQRQRESMGVGCRERKLACRERKKSRDKAIVPAYGLQRAPSSPSSFFISLYLFLFPLRHSLNFAIVGNWVGLWDILENENPFRLLIVLFHLKKDPARRWICTTRIT